MSPQLEAYVAQQEQLFKMKQTTLSFKEADWFINFNSYDKTTALVIPGADGIGVMFIVLNGNHIADFQKVIDEYKNWSEEINGCLGECIRWAIKQDDIIPQRCTIGVFNQKIKFVQK